MGYTNFPNGVTSFGIPLPSCGQDISGSTYFVDNNSGSDSNDGSSFKRAFKTFARATVISNIDIARGSDRWARRNTIYYCADTETTTIVAFPNKCDVIGVGSYDANTMPGITGSHSPVNAGNQGTRFFNIKFNATGIATNIITLASTSGGTQFVGCIFQGGDGGAIQSTYAIQNTASSNMQVHGCRFYGHYQTGCIHFGTGAVDGTLIQDNIIHTTGGIGIDNVTGTTALSFGLMVKDNVISLEGTELCIDDEADTSTGIMYTIGNRCSNEATLTNFAGRTGIVDLNEDRAIDNICTGADIGLRVPLLVVA